MLFDVNRNNPLYLGRFMLKMDWLMSNVFKVSFLIMLTIILLKVFYDFNLCRFIYLFYQNIFLNSVSCYRPFYQTIDSVILLRILISNLVCQTGLTWKSNIILSKWILTSWWLLWLWCWWCKWDCCICLVELLIGWLTCPYCDWWVWLCW